MTTDLAAARAARDAGIALAEDADTDGWDSAVIDQAIRERVERGEPFSANDIRDRLPDVRSALMGARFMAARKRGLIVRIGYVPSTDRRTHAHPITLWQGAT
ncbi:hypothetical protein [Allonocardiopsis opalescens]|uniref:Uncharacterized protein n=1 Tax=Allonocardiopsis opalescens TaxID=1144618 RepID=A0A2T0PP54_9ACTN|nr:hypothetical protein [Allonocardiopsis opalescens]PRX90682.1 hypothetical protein CLV72_11820 [Allonocardiopsis opalescens]